MVSIKMFPPLVAYHYLLFYFFMNNTQNLESNPLGPVLCINFYT